MTQQMTTDTTTTTTWRIVDEAGNVRLDQCASEAAAHEVIRSFGRRFAGCTVEPSESPPHTSLLLSECTCEVCR